ncbi:MAG: YezD family protein [Gammaproteobacteria bacterium]
MVERRANLTLSMGPCKQDDASLSYFDLALKLLSLWSTRFEQAHRGVWVAEEARRELEQLVAEAIAGIRYGAVEITIHDGRIVQIEKREKLRSGATAPARSAPPGGLPTSR